MSGNRGVRHRLSGFSLIELLVVVGIIAIMAAVSLPAIARYFRNFQLRGAVQQVASEIQTARTKAIMKNVNYGVAFFTVSPTQFRYVVEDLPTGTLGPTRETMVNLTAPPLEAQQAGPIQTLPGNIRFAASGAECGPVNAAFAPNDTGFRFDRLGRSCDPTGPIAPGQACPDLGVGDALVMNGGASRMVCVFDPFTGLSHTISVEPGGKVAVRP